MFLIILTIVWLTNSHYAAEKAESAGAKPAAEASAAAPQPEVKK
jgi:hypothetical protein